MKLPIIDIEALRADSSEKLKVAKQIGEACETSGFFYIVNHGIDDSLQEELERLSSIFFLRLTEEKMQIAMLQAGRAWRGYFPVGGELTSGKADRKEGIYFGEELPPTHPDVIAKLPMHGANLFPIFMPELRRVVLEYMSQLTALGHIMMRGISLSLGLEENYIHKHFTKDPFILFRIFNYPKNTAASKDEWGVGEHTDYGLLTILKQDDCGGLEVKSKTGWISAPPIAGSFVCNIGDMLDFLTGGRYVSTPHRVRNIADRDRLSFPFFFDPGFHAQMHKLPSPHQFPKQSRWDGADVQAFQGRYGDYLLSKVGKVFPDLKKSTSP